MGFLGGGGTGIYKKTNTCISYFESVFTKKLPVKRQPKYLKPARQGKLMSRQFFFVANTPPNMIHVYV